MATDHFEKHYYQKDRVDWNFNLLFDGQPAVAQMAKEYASALQHPGLYAPVPPQWLHSTILRVGLTDDYTEAEMLAVAAALEQSLASLALPEFFCDSWWLWGGNVVLHISPDDQFSKLYACVVAALASVVGKDRTTHVPHDSFIPHITLAYTKTHQQEQAIHDRLVAQPVQPVGFHAKGIALIKQWPTDGHYEWEIVKEIRL
jgi:2'-5' RNA ligase